MAAAPKLLRIARELAGFVGENTEDAPAELLTLGRRADTIVRSLAETAAPKPGDKPASEAAE